MTTKKDGWSALNTPPSEMTSGSIVQLDDGKFMIATYTRENIIGGFYIFNMKNNEWTLWMKYPNEWDIDQHTLMLDKPRNTLYLFALMRRGEMLKIKQKHL